jgi:3-oxoadipate enol-lactonase
MIPHYRIDGEQGPMVVLASSLGTTLAMWHDFAADLAADHRVLRYDHRGHGDSGVPPGPYSMAELAGDVVDLLDAVGEPSALFCGLSLGGCVGQWLGANAPERIDRMVIACTSPTFGAAEGWHQRAAAVRASGTESVADAVLARWFTPEFAIARPEVVARLREIFVSIPDEGYAGCCAALADWDFTAELPRIAPPTLIIAGDRDPAAPPAEATAMAEAVPDSRLVVLEHAAHLACIEQPEAFTRAVRAHLGEGGR